jgi:hypothetical protein
MGLELDETSLMKVSMACAHIKVMFCVVVLGEGVGEEVDEAVGVACTLIRFSVGEGMAVERCDEGIIDESEDGYEIVALRLWKQ